MYNHTVHDTKKKKRYRYKGKARYRATFATSMKQRRDKRQRRMTLACSWQICVSVANGHDRPIDVQKTLRIRTKKIRPGLPRLARAHQEGGG